MIRANVIKRDPNAVIDLTEEEDDVIAAYDGVVQVSYYAVSLSCLYYHCSLYYRHLAFEISVSEFHRFNLRRI